MVDQSRKAQAEEAVAFLSASAGFALTDQQRSEYVEAYLHVADMSARLKRDRSYMDEPAHLFGYNMESRHD